MDPASPRKGTAGGNNMSSRPRPNNAKKLLVAAGWLFKKAPKGISGFKMWQKRYFKVTLKEIIYSKSDSGAQLGTIKLLEIKSVTYLPDKRMGARFDIVVKTGRTFQMHSGSKEETFQWIEAINYAVQEAKKTQAIEQKTSEKIIDARKYSQVQLACFDAYYGKDKLVSTNKHLAKIIIEHIENTFQTDEDLFTFLLEKIFDPSAGFCTFDFTEKDFTGEEQAEEEEDIYLFHDEETGDGPNFVQTMSVPDVLAELRYYTDTDPLSFLPLFNEDGIHCMEDLTTVGVPAGVPEELADLIEKGLDRMRINTSNVDEPNEDEVINHKEGVERLYSMITNNRQDFLRRLVMVFSTNNEPAHALAVRILWATYFSFYKPQKALEELTAQFHIQLSGKSSLSVIHALITILLSENADVTSKLECINKVNFYMKVKSPYMWQPLLTSLHNCNMEIRKQALADINSLLHDNIHNCETLISTNQWQRSFYFLLTDIPINQRKVDPYKSSYAFNINSLCMVHFEYLAKKETEIFAQLLDDTITAVYAFAGPVSDGQKLVSNFLLSVASKLSFNKNKFPADQTTLPWANLVAFSDVVKKFIFTTAMWATEPKKGVYANDYGDTQEIDLEDDFDDEQGYQLAFHDEINDYGPEERGSNLDPGAIAHNGRMQSLLADNAGKRISLVDDREFSFDEGMPRDHFSSYDDAEEEVRMVLTRGQRSQDSWYEEEPKLHNYGLHWANEEEDELERCYDVSLACKMRDLLKILRCNEFDPALAGIGMEKEELDLKTKYAQLYDWWDDTARFIMLAKRGDIISRKVISYRQLAFLVRKFLGLSSKGARESCVEDYQKIIDKKVGMAGNSFAPDRSSGK